MDASSFITIGCAVALAAVYFFLNRNKPLDPVSLARKLVVDAEQLITPRDGESWSDANKRKLAYVIEKMKEVYPDLDVAFLVNLAEYGVDVLKNRAGK